MGSRFLGYMGSDHIVTYGRADSLRDQGCHTGDKSIDHNRNTKGSTADKYACHTCNVQTTDFCKDIDRILRVRLVFVDRFFDRGDLAVQTIAGKTCAASCHLLHRTVKKNRCNSTTGRSISDSHLSCCKKTVSLLFES